MKVETPQIMWHAQSEDGKNAPLYSVSMSDDGILATAGNTPDVHLWHGLQHRCTLTRHQQNVNCVRFCKNALASVGGFGSVVIWTCNNNNHSTTTTNNNNHINSNNSGWLSVEKESHLTTKCISTGCDDLAHVDWSADGTRLVVASIHHTVLVYSIDGEQLYRNSCDHTLYVQGVAYDPLSNYMASMGSDRTLRIYPRKKKKLQSNNHNKSSANTKKKWLETSKLLFGKTKTIKYANHNAAKKTEEAQKKTYWFADESTVESFFRRPAWTPDGAFLLTPTALLGGGFGTLLWARHKFDAPHKVLGGINKPSVAVSCNPVLFCLPQDNDYCIHNAQNALPYRCIFCVLTLDTVLVYDTHHDRPLCTMSGLHYTNLTDATWSRDGHTLIVSSTDGYVSIVMFEKGELGEVYHYEEPKEEIVTVTKPSVIVDNNTTRLPVVSKSTKKMPKRITPILLLPPTESGQMAVLQSPPLKKTKFMSDPTTMSPQKRLQENEDVIGGVFGGLSLQPTKKKKRVALITIN